MDGIEAEAVAVNEGGDVDDGAHDHGARDLSEDAIAARMAELGHDGPAPEVDEGTDDDVEGEVVDDASKDAKKKGATTDDAVDDKEPKTEEERKSWQAKMKAEVEKTKAETTALQQRVQQADVRENEWVRAANETLLELHAVAAERDLYASLLERAGVKLDPRDQELHKLRVELARSKGGQGLEQQIVKRQQQAQIVAMAQTVKSQTEQEATALIAKHAELKDPDVAEEILTAWNAVASAAARKGKEPPTMTAFVEKQLAALRYGKKLPQIEAKRARLQQGRKAPRTLNVNGSSGVPAKFPATDEGIAAWAKAKGYE